MLTKKEKMAKIIQVIIVFIAIDFIASIFQNINGMFGILPYLFFGSLIFVYGFYLLKKKDDYMLKTYFYL